MVVDDHNSVFRRLRITSSMPISKAISMNYFFPRQKKLCKKKKTKNLKGIEESLEIGIIRSSDACR